MRKAGWSSYVCLSLVLGGCSADLTIPEETSVACETSADCAGDLICATAVGRCVAPDKASAEGPKLVDFNYERAVGSFGSELVLTFEVSKPLATPPTVRMDTGARVAPWTLDASRSDSAALRYTYVYEVDGSEMAGTIPVSMDLTDTLGNVTRGIGVGNIEIDFTAPRVLVSDVNRVHLNPGAEATLSLSFETDDLAGSPAVWMRLRGAAEAAPFAWPLIEGDGYRHRLTVDPAVHAEGIYTLWVQAVDRAGNDSGPLELPHVCHLDFSPPSVEQVEISPALARPTDVVRISVRVSEPPSGSPTVRLSQPGSGDMTIGQPQIINQALTFLREAQPGENGNFAIYLEGLEDLAGNAMTGPEATYLGSVTLDSAAPTYQNFTGEGTYQASDTLEVTFEVSEPLGEDPKVRLKDVPLTKTAGTGLGPYTYALDLSTTNFNGDIPIFLTLEDVAGNRELYNPGTASLDTLPPQLVDVVFSPPVAKNNITAVLTVTFDEALDGRPALQWATPPGDPGFTFLSKSGLSTTYALPIGAQSGPGTYTLASTSARDVAGNQAIELPVGATFTIDNAPPQFVVEPEVDGAGFYRAGDVIEVRVHTNESMAEGFPAVQLTAGGGTFTCTEASNHTYDCRLDTPLDPQIQPEGTAGVSVELKDLAGNTAFSSVPVSLDFTPPTLLSSPGPDLFKLQDVVTFTVTFSEPLPPGKLPTLQVFRDGAEIPHFFPDVPVSQTDRSFTYIHPIGDCNGENPCSKDGIYEVQATGEDRAGNVGTQLSPDSFAIDASPPVFVTPPASGTANAAQEHYRAGERVAVTFKIDDPLGTDPPVVRLLTPSPFDMDDCSGTNNVWTCTLAQPLEGNEVINEVPSGTPVEIHVLVTDAAGNQTFASTTVTLDFTTPGILPGSVDVQLLPDPGNRLASQGVTAATVGTQIQLAFSVDEVLAADPLVRSVPEDLGWTKLGGNTTLVYGHALAAPGWRQGAYTFRVTLRDVAGNESVIQLGSDAGFSVDTLPPPAPDTDTPRRVLLRRAPWGDAVGSRRMTLEATAGAVEPSAHVFVYDASDVTSDATTEMGAGKADASGGFGTAVGQDPLTLKGGDQVGVYLAAVDSAGNYSDHDNDPNNGIQATLVRDVEWTATMAGKVAGDTFSNPHMFVERPYFQTSYAQSGSMEWGDAPPSTLGQADGASLASTTQGHWQHAYPSGATPHRRFGAKMAYDSHRGVTVLYGGIDNEFSSGCGEGAGDACVYTWEWNGSFWRRVIPLDPEGDGNPGRAYNGAEMVYDSRRRVVVLVDDEGSQMVVWEYDGTSWRRRCTRSPCIDHSPGLRSDFAMAYDAGRGVSVLYGGNNNSETWAWDGQRWHLRTPADPEGDGNPGVRHDHQMVYDATRRRIMMWGGYGGGFTPETDFWSWDGASWERITPSGGPQGREAFGMVYDHRRDRIVVYGGFSGSGNCDGSGDSFCEGTWEYAPGGNWWSSERCRFTPCRQNRPTRRYAVGMAYDAGRGRAVIFGGSAGTTAHCDWPSTYHHCRSTAEWDGSWWHPRGPANVGSGVPLERTGAAMAFNHYYNRLWLFGGESSYSSCEGSGDSFCRYMWGWDGGSWERWLPSGDWPTSRHNAAMVSNGWTYVYLYGGRNSESGCDEGVANSEYCDELWRWSTSAWTRVSTSGWGPGGRENHAMAYDSSRNELLVVGGYYDTSHATSTHRLDLNDNTWTWVDLCLFPPCSFTEPPPLSNGGLVYDASRDRYVYFGGSGPGYPSGSNETWEFDPDSGTWRQVCTASPCADNVPGPRWSHAMWYDAATRRVVVANGANQEDTWAWDGSVWRQLEPLELTDDGQPERSGDFVTAYDSRQERAYVYGGNLFGEQNLWFYDAGGQTTPGLVMHASYAAAGTDGYESIRAVSPAWLVGAESTYSGSATAGDGAMLTGWAGGRWRDLASHTASPNAPAPLSSTLTDPETIASLFVGPEQDMAFAARGARGANGHGAARVAVDHAQVTVHYRLPDACTNDVKAAGVAEIEVASGTTSVTGDTCVCSHDFAPTCSGSDAPDALYKLEVPSTGAWTLDARSYGFDTVLYLRQAKRLGGDIACNDNSSPPGNGGSRVVQPLSNEATYYLIVDGQGSKCGSFVVDVSF